LDTTNTAQKYEKLWVMGISKMAFWFSIPHWPVYTWNVHTVENKFWECKWSFMFDSIFSQHFPSMCKHWLIEYVRHGNKNCE